MKMHTATKILIVIFIIIFFYLLFFLALSPFFIQQPRSMADIMRQMMGFSTQTSVVLNALSLILAIGIGILISVLILPHEPKTEIKEVKEELHREKKSILREMKEKEFSIIKRALTEDEKKVVSEIERAGKITQDSLRARLGWSKAKISTILTNLDKADIIQRERQGKTYSVFLTKRRRE